MMRSAIEDRATAIEEGAHAVVGAELGLRVVSASIVGDSSAGTAGRVAFEAALDERSFLVTTLAGEIAVRDLMPAYFLDTAGREEEGQDTQIARVLARRIGEREGQDPARVMALATFWASRLVTGSRQMIEAVADALQDSGEISGARVRRVIAEVERKHFGSAARKAHLRSIAAAPKYSRVNDPRARRQRAAKPKARGISRDTAAWFVATESFTAQLDGKREQIKAGMSGVAAGHELLRRYPDKFEPVVSNAEARRSAVLGMVNSTGSTREITWR